MFNKLQATSVVIKVRMSWCEEWKVVPLPDPNVVEWSVETVIGSGAGPILAVVGSGGPSTGQ